MLPWWLRQEKNPPTMQEILILFLGQEEPLEKGMATHSNILVWEIPWTLEPGRVHGVTKSQTVLGTHALCAKEASGRKPELS